MIQYGDADAVVAGGTEATLSDFGFGSFNVMQALSDMGISCPFDARRDGFVMGEGSGVLVLEDYDMAVARGATIIGEVAGFGSTSDAHHLTACDRTRSATSTPTAPRPSSTMPPKPRR
jgi:3-oxoacyl-[acyl-carrier-protein] synthase II